jgi:hypothetical protein
MATGFSLNDTACRQIRAEGRLMRHFRNSLALTEPFSVHRAASFSQHRATDRKQDELKRTRRNPTSHTAAVAAWFPQPSEYSRQFNVW